jgi:PAS domain S-box-containing protein
MGALIRSLDWSRTPVGPISTWPQSLRTALGICLSSRFPMAIWWGPDVVQFYNDGYRPFLGSKHPRSMGQRGDECWAEIWDVCGPLYRHVMTTGDSTWSADLQLLMDRNGYVEETYFTFSYSPIRGETAEVLGNLITVTETTERVVSERRLRTLRDISALTLAGATPDEAGRLALETLGANSADVPFALLYLMDDDGRRARLVAGSGTSPGTIASPEIIDLNDEAVWPIAPVIASGEALAVHDLARMGPLPTGAWTDPAPMALVLPLVTPDAVAGVLIAAVSPRRPLDDSYRSFYHLLAGQVAAALANARAHHAERQRAEALAALDRAKTEFFTNVSHEFRTPLTLMLGPLDDALRSPDLPPDDRERLLVAQRNSLRLLKLVNTLLDFSRIEAERVEVVYEPLDVALLTADLASTFGSAIERARLRLTVECPPLAEPVWVDREMWEKIVLNLLSNAFKFTFEGEIAVRVRADGDRVRLDVADTGVGIGPEDLPHVFERFHRARNVRSRTHEGTGIGLALVRQLVELHGGTIDVTSEVGRGTTFTIAMPRGTAHLPADRIGVDRTRASTSVSASVFAEEAARWLPEDTAADPDPRPTSMAAGSEDARLPATVSTAGARVLLVDDNADMRDYVGRLLAPYWSIDVAADGLEALAKAQAHPPELVLTDVMMPNLDGYGLLKALRADPRTATTTVILLSARAGEESRLEGLTTGAEDYLVKPFLAQELIARVNAHLRLSRARRETQRELEDFFENSVLAVHWAAPDGTLLRVNRAELDLLGYPSHDYVGHNIAEFHVDPDVVADLMGRLAAGESVHNCPARLRARDGSIRYVMISANGRWEDGRFVQARCFTRDVTELRLAEEERLRLLHVEQEARRTAEAASRAKDEFLAMLAHELRNPLGVILNGLKILDRVGHADDEPARIRALMTRQTEHLARLLDDLLDLARISQGRIELRKEPIDLRTVVDFAVESERHRLVAKSQALDIAMPPVPVMIYADQARMQQVVGNLIHNASKYTPERGRVTVSVEPARDEVRVRVRDTGVGIPPEKLAAIFDLFVQLDTSPDRAQGGLGIGLTLVRRLVEQHGGTVRAESEGLGHGTEFIVTVPLTTAAPRQPSTGEHPSSARRLQILLIEDNADAREMLQFGLTLAGHQVQAAADGDAGIACAVASPPDVAIVDLGLPRVDGFGVARALRATLGPTVRLIALTGYGQQTDRERTRAAGFDAHVTKPATVEDVLAALPD